MSWSVGDLVPRKIKGFSQEYLDASSPRSEKIREHLERNGFRGPEAAEIAAHATREKKQDLTKEQVLQAHREVAAEFGNEASRVVAEARQRSIQQGVRSAVSRARAGSDHLCPRPSCSSGRPLPMSGRS